VLNNKLPASWVISGDTIDKMSAGPYNYSYIFKYIIIGEFLVTMQPLC